MKIALFLLLFICGYSSAQSYKKPDGTMPVEIVYFVGDVADTSALVKLRWGTATEVNNYGYDILRADTSFEWQAINFVQGHGNSNSPKDYLYCDTTITENGIYFYMLRQIDFDGKYELYHDTVQVAVEYFTSVKNDYTPISEFKLFQNYPNPFNPGTIIKFSINKPSKVRLKVYSVTGEEVATLIKGEVITGTHKVKYIPENLSTGIYIYKLIVGNNKISKKMLFIK